MVSNSELIKHLESTATKAGIVDRLKIKYRPVICPFDLLLRYTEGKKSVFDIGCGSGQFVSVIARFTSVEKIKGIEISETLIKNAREINAQFSDKKKISFEVFDGVKIPDDIAEYEVIFLIDVLHHVPKAAQQAFIQKIKEKMSPGSILVLKDIDASSAFVVFNKLHDLVFSKEIGHEMSHNNLLKFTQQIGFDVVESFTKRVFVYPHYFVVVKKQQ